MFELATGLLPIAREELIQFCAIYLKSEFDPIRYADALIEETDLSMDARFEIRGFDTKTGNPVTIAFSDNDVIWENNE